MSTFYNLVIFRVIINTLLRNPDNESLTHRQYGCRYIVEPRKIPCVFLFSFLILITIVVLKQNKK